MRANPQMAVLVAVSNAPLATLMPVLQEAAAQPAQVPSNRAAAEVSAAVVAHVPQDQYPVRQLRRRSGTPASDANRPVLG